MEGHAVNAINQIVHKEKNFFAIASMVCTWDACLSRVPLDQFAVNGGDYIPFLEYSLTIMIILLMALVIVYSRLRKRLNELRKKRARILASRDRGSEK